jgi:hypothetical protein
MVNQRTVNQRMGNHTGHRVETPLLLSPKTLTPLCPISKNRIQKIRKMRLSVLSISKQLFTDD